ncbi:hypothetical protein H0264_37390 [Nocardia huaxiensis]|uniref:Uncharacterized protein n=1 Tax=Nocardia huaxiensis TaxID=2755382 RepID=A0A7D6ZHK0_9NOCA|nr:hypothetical protein [Nocardia huaxiensis]QLY30707.1 hypothetical protein H0264_37390 [Nocardia huaxiensis]
MSNPLRPQAIALLRQLSGGQPDRFLWSELWNELYHLHSEEDACAALPALAHAAATGTPETRSEAITLASGVLNNAGGVEEVRQYGAAISLLLNVVHDSLTTVPGKDDIAPADFICRLQSMLAFEDETVWAQKLDCLIEEELELDCPTCGTTIHMCLGRDGTFTCTVDYGLGNSGHAPLIPAAPHHLTGLGARLYQLAMTARQPATARQITALFGHATCSPDGHQFVPAEVTGYEWAL